MTGVSSATVSYYLNGRLDKMGEQTRSRIERAIAQTGYVPSAAARGLASKSSGVIAVLICDLTNAWAGQLLTGVENEARSLGYQTVVCGTDFKPAVENLVIEKLLSLGVDGFVIQPSSQARSVRERLAKANRPVVFYDYDMLDVDGYWVKTDLYGAFYDTTISCVERGYEDFLLLSADSGGARTRLERIRGIEDALASRSLECRRIPISHEEPRPEGLRRAIELGSNPARRTLVICPHQWALSRVYEALRPSMSLVPDRIGLVGLGNAQWTSLVSPSVTTVIEPVEEEGRLAVSNLVALLGGNSDFDSRHVLRCETRWLESTGDRR